MQVLDKDGKLVERPDETLTQDLLSGQYGTRSDTVVVKTGDGKLSNIPTKNLGEFAKLKGGKIQVLSDAQVAAHDAETARQKRAEELDTLGMHVKGDIASAASGVTLGASDAVLGQVLSQQHKRDLEEYRDQHPLEAGGFSLAGAVLPSLLLGPEVEGAEAATLAARVGVGLDEAAGAVRASSKVRDALGLAKSAFTAPTRALAAASSGAEHVVGGIVGHEAESLAGQVAQQALTRAAGGAVMGSASSVGQDLGENQLSTDHQLTGEQILHNAGINALFGGALGAAGGVASKVFSHFMTGEREDAIGSFIQKKAAEIQFDATGAKTKEGNRLFGGGMSGGGELTKEAAGRWALDELPKFTEDGKAPLTREAKALAAERAANEASHEIGGHIDVLDRVGVKPNGEGIFNRVREDVIKPLEGSIDPRAKSIVTNMNEMVDKAEAKFNQNPTFRQVFDLRREIDQAVHKWKADPTQTTFNNSLKDARRVVEDEIGKQGAASLGPQWATGYNDAKRQFQMATTIRDAVRMSDVRVGSNNKIGLSDTILGAQMLHSAGAAALSGHPLVAVAALATAVGHHLIKKYGEEIGSRMLDGLVKSGELGRTVIPIAAARAIQAAQRNYQVAAVRAVGALTKGIQSPGEPGRPRTVDGDFETKSNAIRQMLQNPQGHAEAIEAHARALGPAFATVGSSYQSAAMSASLTLAQALPRARPIDPMSPKAGKIEPDVVAKQKFNDLYDAVEDPTTLIHKAAQGTLTREEVAIVQQTAPASLTDLRTRVTQAMAQLKEPLSPEQLASVKVLMGQPVFDHPIAEAPPVPPPMPTGAPGGKRGKAVSRPLKLNITPIAGLTGTRAPAGV